MAGQLGELHVVESESGVGTTLGPFVTIRAVGRVGSTPTHLVGQVDLDTARSLALQLLEVTAGAEQDALVATVLAEPDGTLGPTAAAMIGRLRDLRDPGGG